MGSTEFIVDEYMVLCSMVVFSINVTKKYAVRMIEMTKQFLNHLFSCCKARKPKRSSIVPMGWKNVIKKSKVQCNGSQRYAHQNAVHGLFPKGFFCGIILGR